MWTRGIVEEGFTRILLLQDRISSGVTAEKHVLWLRNMVEENSIADYINIELLRWDDDNSFDTTNITVRFKLGHYV